MKTTPQHKARTDKIKTLFHRCWGAAHESTQYNKADWLDLQAELRKLGLPL